LGYSDSSDAQSSVSMRTVGKVSRSTGYLLATRSIGPSSAMMPSSSSRQQKGHLWPLSTTVTGLVPPILVSKTRWVCLEVMAKSPCWLESYFFYYTIPGKIPKPVMLGLSAKKRTAQPCSAIDMRGIAAVFLYVDYQLGDINRRITDV